MKKFLKYKKLKNCSRFCKKSIKLLKFGNIGLKSQNYGLIKFKQYESVRLLISKILKKKGKFWFRVKNTNMPLSKKNLKSRMGKGKGKISHWVIMVKPGQIFFEIFFFSYSILFIKLLIKEIQNRLPIKSKIIIF